MDKPMNRIKEVLEVASSKLGWQKNSARASAWSMRMFATGGPIMQSLLLVWSTKEKATARSW